MAKFVYDIEEVKLQDDSVVELRPLTIRNHREIMKVLTEEMPELFEKARKSESKEVSEDDITAIMFKACRIAFRKSRPDLVEKTDDELEDILDMPTLNRIIEVASGLKLEGAEGDPNPKAAGQVGIA